MTPAVRPRWNLEPSFTRPTATMKRLLLIILFALLLAPTSFAQTAEELFQQATQKERVEGDLNGAIELLERVVESSTDRGLSAQALVQIGEYHERMGRSNAISAYQRVVREYADFPQVVIKAEDGLSRLTNPQLAAELDEKFDLSIPDGAEEWGASLSPDGRFLISPYWGDNDNNGVMVQDVRTGDFEVHDLEMGEGPGGSAEFASMSPDGSMIAAGWYPAGINCCATIRVKDLQSGQVRELISTHAYWQDRHGKELTNANAQAIEWTSDGRSILSFFSSTTEPEEGSADYGWYEELALVHLDGSSPSLISDTSTMGVYSWANSCMTSDKRFVFSQFQKQNGPQPDVIVRFDLGTGDAQLWRSHPFYRMVLVGCSSNPEKVLFTEEQLGTKRLLSADPTSASGSEGQVIRSVPTNTYFGIGSKNGSVIHWPQSERALWSAKVDPHTSDVTSQLRQNSASAVGGASMWSPTGNQIAWWDNSEKQLVVWNAETNARKTFKHEKGYAVWPTNFSESGLHLKVRNPSEGIILILDTMTMEVAESQDNGSYTNRGLWYPWDNPSSDRMYLLRASDNCLIGFHKDDDSIEEVACTANQKEYGPVVLRVSPDREHVGIEWGDRTNEDASTQVEIINTQTGTATLVFESDTSEYRFNRFMGWVGDNHILMARQLNLNDTREVRLVDINTGEYESILQGLIENISVRFLRLSHDRKHVIAYGSPRISEGENSRATVLTELHR